MLAVSGVDLMVAEHVLGVGGDPAVTPGVRPADTNVVLLAPLEGDPVGCGGMALVTRRPEPEVGLGVGEQVGHALDNVLGVLLDTDGADVRSRGFVVVVPGLADGLGREQKVAVGRTEDEPLDATGNEGEVVDVVAAAAGGKADGHLDEPTVDAEAVARTEGGGHADVGREVLHRGVGRGDLQFPVGVLVEVRLRAVDDEPALLMGEVAPVEANVAVGENQRERAVAGRDLVFPRELALRE